MRGPQGENLPTQQGKGTMVLLSLFDGVGTARVAIEELLGAYKALHRLKASWFVELDTELSGHVQRWWQAHHEQTGDRPTGSFVPMFGTSCEDPGSCRTSFAPSQREACFSS